MQTAPDYPSGQDAQPVIDVSSLDLWEQEYVPELKRKFQTHIYGAYPNRIELEILERRSLPSDFLAGKADIETVQLRLLNSENKEIRDFGLVIVRPSNALDPVPVIISQNFCPNHSVIPAAGIPRPDAIGFDCTGDGLLTKVFLYFFGRYITTPPLEHIIDRGYGFAAMYPNEFIPDSGSTGLATLNRFFSNQPDPQRSGALIAWAKQFNLVADWLEQDPQFSNTILYGHSRFGKTALIAAAYNVNIDAVIAHQSGTGGASLSRQKPGETIADITGGYPHWFGQSYKQFADKSADLPIDQHQLLALTAPRPVLLGNARRDVWSDPNGAFRAAAAAQPIYELYDDPGLTQKRLSDFDPESSLAFWIRPGTHGVVTEDWPAFLRFLDHHFK